MCNSVFAVSVFVVSILQLGVGPSHGRVERKIMMYVSKIEIFRSSNYAVKM